MIKQRIECLENKLKELDLREYNKSSKDFNLEEIDEYGTECFNDGFIKGLNQQIKEELKFLKELDK